MAANVFGVLAVTDALRANVLASSQKKIVGIASAAGIDRVPWLRRVSVLLHQQDGDEQGTTVHGGRAGRPWRYCWHGRARCCRYRHAQSCRWR